MITDLVSAQSFLKCNICALQSFEDLIQFGLYFSELDLGHLVFVLQRRNLCLTKFQKHGWTGHNLKLKSINQSEHNLISTMVKQNSPATMQPSQPVLQDPSARSKTLQ